PPCAGEGEQKPLLRARGMTSAQPMFAPRSGWGGGLSAVAAAGIAVLAFGLVLWGDAADALRPHVQSRAPTWLDDLRAKGWRPDDPSALVLAEAPLVTQLYLGRADFYVHPE